jgi:sec-independent protein translocase protein TatA
MVGDILQPTHLLFVLVVALLVLGPKRLPEVGRTLGSGLRDFRQALSGESSSEQQDPYVHREPETVQETSLRLHDLEPDPEPVHAGEPVHAETAEATHPAADARTEPGA